MKILSQVCKPQDLEWLLLADIPEREIRPDTRAAFAAGQIAALAPLLIQEADGIIDTNRELAQIQKDLLSLKKNPESNRSKIQKYEEKIKEQITLLNTQKQNLVDKEKGHLARCFGHLLHAMTEHPGKARLFFRLHQYGLLTGHKGLKEIAEWTKGLRTQGACVWADYYANLTLQILAQNILKAIRVCTTPFSLHSDQEAAKSHLEDIAGIDQNIFNTNAGDRSWFHEVARREYAASASIAAEYLKQHGLQELASKFSKIVEFYHAPALNDNSLAWLEKTGYHSGNWAYLAERHLSAEPSLGTDSYPTCLWEIFARGFDYRRVSDQRAIRLYPGAMPEKAWKYLLASNSVAKDDDSGWIYEILENKHEWAKDAEKVHTEAFMRASRVLKAKDNTHISISVWTKHISNACSPFDPRLSEWTALEIIRRVVEPKLQLGTSVSLEQTHPQNILIPKEWIDIEKDDSRSCLSWEELLAAG